LTSEMTPEDLSSYGIGDGISEVIATTQSSSGKPNAAPVGIINRGELLIRLYKSRTLSNVLETMKIAANICADAMIFAITALGDIDDEKFTHFRGFPVLKDADAWILFRCHMRERAANFFVFNLEPIAMHANRKRVMAVNRGFNAVIEAAILATRAKNTEKSVKMMEHYKRIVDKCGGRREKDAMNFVISAFRRICDEG